VNLSSSIRTSLLPLAASACYASADWVFLQALLFSSLIWSEAVLWPRAESAAQPQRWISQGHLQGFLERCLPVIVPCVLCRCAQMAQKTFAPAMGRWQKENTRDDAPPSSFGGPRDHTLQRWTRGMPLRWRMNSSADPPTQPEGEADLWMFVVCRSDP
jgi:hypothetical protein